MKKLTLILFLFSFLLGYSQNNSGETQQEAQKKVKTTDVNSESNNPPQPTQAQDWNSSRSNKTSKTSGIAIPNGGTSPQPTQAQDWNSSRSNKTSKTSRMGNPDSNNPFIKDRISITIGLSSGISTPSSNFSDNAYAKNGNYFELTGAYYFSKFGIGVSLGQISSPTNENFSSSTNAIDLSITNTTQNWKQFYYGIGPEYKTHFGNFSATFSTKIGLQSVESVNLESNYNNGETPITILKIKSDKNTSLSYFSTDLKFGYNISSNFSLYATVNYMSALSNGITLSQGEIPDTNQNGIVDAEDLKFATGSATIDYKISTKNIKPQSTNFGIGLNFEFGNNFSTVKRKRPGRVKYSNITLERSQAEGDGNNENNGTRAIDHNGSRSNTTASKIDSKDDENGENNTTRRGKRKAKKECLKNGGSFWESGDGSYHCMMPLSTAKIGENTNNKLFRSKKRKCFKAGGKWVTNSHGSFCWNPSATTKVYGPGDAHYGHITVKDSKKQNAKVEVRGWDSKEKSTSKKGYDYYKATNKLDEDSNGDGLSNILKAEERKKKFKTKVKSTKKTTRTGRNPQTGATIKGIAKTDSKGDGNNENNGTKAIDHNGSRSNTTASKIDSKGDDGDNDNNGTRAFNHNASRSNTTASKIDSKGGGNGEIQQGYTKESTMVFIRVDETSLRKSNTKIPKDKSIQKNDKRMSKRTLRSRKRHGDKRYRERVKARTLRSADKRYRERTKARTLRSADKRYRERTKARTLRSADKRYRERTKARTLRSADKRYRERTKARTLRSADKRYRERTKARTLRSADKRYRERTKARTLRSADKRYRERTKARTLNPIQNDKPVQITTEKNNKVKPSTNLDTRFFKVQNYQTIQIAKSKFQLTAPLIIGKNKTELINYNWTVKNNKQNKEDKFTGKTINYNFDVSGTYQIEITPVVNNKKLSSYHLNIICN